MRSNLLSKPVSIRGRLALWLHERAYGLTLAAMLALVLALLSSSCASHETTERLRAAEARMAEVQADPEATDVQWRDAVIELAQARGAYVEEVGTNAQGWLTDLPASAEGGAMGAAVAGLLYLMRSRSRSRLEGEVAGTHSLAARALKAAEAAEAHAVEAAVEVGKIKGSRAIG